MTPSKLQVSFNPFKTSPNPSPLQTSRRSSPKSSNISILPSKSPSLPENRPPKMSNATQSMNPEDIQSSKDSHYGIILYITFLIIIVIVSFISIIWKRIRLGWSWCGGEGNRDYDQDGYMSSDIEQDSITARENGVNEATLDEYYPKFLCSDAHKVVYADKVGVSTASSCCSVCLGEYKDTEMIRLLPGCGHLFHQKCIDPWLTAHSTCPVCRSYSVPNTQQQPAHLASSLGS